MSKDCYDWEENYTVEVALSIFVWGIDENNNVVKKCGFIEKNNELYLPSLTLTNNNHAAELAVKLAREYIGADIRNVDIMQVGFFDPIGEVEDRHIVLCYKAIITEGIPVKKEVEFYTDERLQISKRRIRAGHYAAYREGHKG